MIDLRQKDQRILTNIHVHHQANPISGQIPGFLIIGPWHPFSHTDETTIGRPPLSPIEEPHYT